MSDWSPTPDPKLHELPREWTEGGWHYPGEPGCDCASCNAAARDYYEKRIRGLVSAKEALRRYDESLLQSGDVDLFREWLKGQVE